MPLFLYGTLLDPRVLARESGDPGLPRAMQPAVLAGFARVRFRGTLYPTLLRDQRGWVKGALIRPSARALAALRRYEGPCYHLIPVRVQTARGPMRARAWAVPRHLAEAPAWRRRSGGH
ncbi:gamma-glutamylcyclotransferase family protein [Roseomonas xinghualingensis]|uniref:gamma-glutamylcyclotransferase family protein n=1 Tax=Roseomonas xinghualingensis TaxID=2986475 RepID=UPI0021F1FCF4|nr:gamma-glutamylcyclotransferase family protein [Roseomonas sp. SXEYE001]MCV4207106.1 gamma-glutamylcyclotransferase [Roseomonas sp. SXEYE001]